MSLWSACLLGGYTLPSPFLVESRVGQRQACLVLTSYRLAHILPAIRDYLGAGSFFPVYHSKQSRASFNVLHSRMQGSLTRPTWYRTNEPSGFKTLKIAIEVDCERSIIRSMLRPFPCGQGASQAIANDVKQHERRGTRGKAHARPG